MAGLVLVDPATVDVYQNMYDSDPARWEAFPEEVSSPHAGWRPQWTALLESLEEVRAAGPPAGVPTVVLTGQTLLPGEWALGTREYMDYWVESHRRLAGSLSDVEHIILPETDHLTILEEAVLPREILELVIDGSPRGAGHGQKEHEKSHRTTRHGDQAYRGLQTDRFAR